MVDTTEIESQMENTKLGEEPKVVQQLQDRHEKAKNFSLISDPSLL